MLCYKRCKKKSLISPLSIFCPLSCLGGDADAVLLHVHDALRHFDRDGVGGELHVERPLQLLRHLVQSV